MVKGRAGTVTPAEGICRRDRTSPAPQEYRTGFEPAEYLLGRQAGSHLPNRYIVDLVEVAVFDPVDERGPFAAGEPRLQLVLP